MYFARSSSGLPPQVKEVWSTAGHIYTEPPFYCPHHHHFHAADALLVVMIILILYYGIQDLSAAPILKVQKKKTVRRVHDSPYLTQLWIMDFGSYVVDYGSWILDP